MKAIKGILIVVLALCILGGGVLLYFKLQPAVSTVSTSPEEVVGMLNDIGELATAEYVYKICETAEKPSASVAGFSIPFTSSKVLYSYEGTIKAGIEFGEIKIRVSELHKTVSVRMPEVRILSNELDFDSLIVYDEKYSPFNTFTFSDMNLSQSALLDDAKKSALDSGLIQRANENAQQIILGSLRGFYGPEEYAITFD